MTEIIGYICALFIGLILGLTGGGGSILTVPVLVYIMGFEPVMGAGYSLFIVGTTSAFGSFLNFKKGIVEVKTALLFAIPSFTSVFLTRKFIVPAIPEILFENKDIILSKNTFLMVLFAVVMFIAALSMLKKLPPKKTAIEVEPNILFSIIKIMLLGILIGLIGAGGGFLIIPALILIVKLPIRKAIGTALLIISLNSIIGFLGDIGNFHLDWPFLITFSFIAIIGISLGIYLSKFVAEKQLKTGFGWFVLAMAIFIITKELFFTL
ncbi:MAG: sulfite exporter TauE/SafE family protein [Bacteroidota bacterium]